MKDVGRKLCFTVINKLDQIMIGKSYDLNRLVNAEVTSPTEEVVWYQCNEPVWNQLEYSEFF